MLDALEMLLVWATAYFFFCAISVDPRHRATIWVGNPFFGIKHRHDTDADPTFKFFTKPPILYATALLFLDKLNPTYCSMHPIRPWSGETIFGICTVTMAGQVFVGPVLQRRKSLRLVG